MGKIIISLIFTLFIFGSIATLNASENQIISPQDISHESPVKIENLSEEQLKLISSNVSEIKEFVGDKVYYNESYMPKLDEPIFLNINGHNIVIYQSNNDVLMQFDDIITYYVDNTVTVTYEEPKVSLLSTTWKYTSTVNVTNKDWVKVLGYASDIVNGVYLAYPTPVLGVSTVILITSSQLATIGSQYYATTYGTQYRYIDTSCSSTSRRVTYWYSNSGKTKYLYNTSNKQVKTDNVYYTGSRSCD